MKKIKALRSTKVALTIDIKFFYIQYILGAHLETQKIVKTKDATTKTTDVLRRKLFVG